jgi:inosine-uridine nucleoside N-ribohydrolase
MSPNTGLAAALVHGVMRRTFTERDMSGFFLHDPLAVAVAGDPSLVNGVRHRADVATVGETRGKTSLGEAHERSLIATHVDAERFVRNLATALGIPNADHRAGLERPE